MRNYNQKLVYRVDAQMVLVMYMHSDLSIKESIRARAELNAMKARRRLSNRLEAF